MAGRPPRADTDRVMFIRRASHQSRLVDEAFRRYLDWRRQLSTCDSAYRRWSQSATQRESAIAFAAYSAAVDSEERAAAQYQNALCAR